MNSAIDTGRAESCDTDDDSGTRRTNRRVAGHDTDGGVRMKNASQ
jgi:hypothetical protein